MTNQTRRRFAMDLSHLKTDPYRLSAKSPPLFRGKIHLAMILPSIVAGVWLVSLAPTTGSKIVAGIYSLTITTMFSASSLFHLKKELSDEGWWRLRQLDHTAIYLLIAGTYLAMAGLSLEGLVRIFLLVAVWGLILGTLIHRWMPLVPSTGTINSLFIGIGWVSVGASRWLWSGLGVTGFLLLLAGGFVYTSGALVLAFRKPNPSPKYFGYHEIWHVGVVIGVTLHYLIVALVIF